jgi:hypothetical protein
MQLLAAIASQDSPYGITAGGAKVEHAREPRATCGKSSRSSSSKPTATRRASTSAPTACSARKVELPASTSPRSSASRRPTQNDLACIERNYQSGTIASGPRSTSETTSSHRSASYVFPDPDESRVREDFAKRNAAFNLDVKSYRENKFVIDQPLIDRLAELHGVPAPKLPVAPTVDVAPSPGAPPAPTPAASPGPAV